MSDAPIHSRPLSPKGRENYDHIFRKAPLTPGTIREYRSDCCGATLKDEQGMHFHYCSGCERPCNSILTRIN